MSEDTIIEVSDLTYRYDNFTAVDHINLTVKRGEIYGFLGPNGAGKTTTIRALMDFIHPVEGSIKIFGMDSREKSVEIHKHVGFMPSELKLWENWTGRQYIAWLENARNQSFMEEAQRLADMFEFDIERSLKGMSTGMKRKMGLIATLAHQPDLLILDEPTMGLDPLMQNVFEELINEIRDEGRTVFLSSHILTEVEDICDRVAIIRSGKIEAIETVAEITRLAFRWLSLSFRDKSAVDVGAFRKIDGVSDLHWEDHRLRMRVSGDANIDALVKAAAQYTVDDLEFDHPSLEEAFLTYYGSKEA